MNKTNRNQPVRFFEENDRLFVCLGLQQSPTMLVRGIKAWLKLLNGKPPVLPSCTCRGRAEFLGHTRSGRWRWPNVEHAGVRWIRYWRWQRVSHTRTVVRECWKGDNQSQWRMANFNHPPPLNPLTDHYQNLQRWLCRGYLPACKILFRSDKGFRFRACATSRTNVYSAIFLGFQQSPTAKTPPQTPTQNTSKDAVLRKDVPFGGSQNQNLTSTPPFSPKTAILGPDLDGTCKFSAEKQL